MPAIVVRRAVDAPVAAVWAVLTGFGDYGRWIPLTTMVIDPPPVRVGWGFAGRTGLGPAGFVDSMLLTLWEPPGPGDTARFRIRKTGRLLAGWADVTLEANGDDHTNVVWREEIILRPEALGRRIGPLMDPLVAHLFGGVVDRMLSAARTGRR